MNIAFPKRPGGSGPKNLPICYICGRQFTAASLPIHEPQCLKKWEIENDRLDPGLRRPKPVKPQERPMGKGGGGFDNEAAWQASQANLVPCESCGRTFAQDRITKHVSICAKSNNAPLKKTAASKPSGSGSSSPPIPTMANKNKNSGGASGGGQRSSSPPIPTLASKPKNEAKSTPPAAAAPKQAPPPAKSGGGAKFCSGCGTGYSAAEKFCTSCGEKR